MDVMLLFISLALATSLGLFGFAAYQGMAARRHGNASGEGGEASNAGLSPISLLRQRRSRFPLSNLLPLSRESEQHMNRQLERAGWPLRVGEYLSIRLATAVLGGGTGLLISLQPVPGLLKVPLIIFLALSGWFIPRLLMSRARRKRLEKIEEQLPDALLAIAKSLQVGAGLLQAVSSATSETPAPLGQELQRTLRDLHLGGEAEEVFSALAERVGSPDMDIVVAAIVIQRTTGGNLSEILLNVSTTIRERAQIRGEIMTITASQRLSANMVALLPVLVVVAFALLQPDFGKLLVQTVAGQVALGIGITLELLGFWLVRRLAVVEV